MTEIMKKYKHYILPICLILVLSFSRAIPHPPNFTPILAVGIFSGFFFRNFFLSSFIVLSSMFVGDLYLGFHGTMIFTYTALIDSVLIGALIKNFKFKELFFTSLFSSFCFFIITNFGAWLTLPMYEKNLAGLLQSYVLAIPFFHNTLISTFIYLIVFKFLFEQFSKRNIFKISS